MRTDYHLNYKLANINAHALDKKQRKENKKKQTV